jgi:enolase-phosphatase E1
VKVPGQVLRRSVSHVLLDIEGTTCPVSFVSGTLFPYAAAKLETFLREHAEDPKVQQLNNEVAAAWRNDPDPAAQALRQETSASLLGYLQWLIQHDRKLTPLKDLQGLLWAEGYRNGELEGPLYDDVPAALSRWHAAGLGIAVYSSGSVAAQKLIYGHSNAGDLRPLFNHWFDTRIGPKRAASSYETIADQLQAEPGQVLFISDSAKECQAAAAAGMQVLFSDREGNPERDPGPFEMITSFEYLELLP